MVCGGSDLGRPVSPKMGNSNSDRGSGAQGERSDRDGQPGGKETRSNILMDSTDDAEDSKVFILFHSSLFEHLCIFALYCSCQYYYAYRPISRYC